MLRNKTELYSHDNILFREMGSFATVTIIFSVSFGVLLPSTCFELLLECRFFAFLHNSVVFSLKLFYI